jgi:hypothetical protein
MRAAVLLAVAVALVNIASMPGQFLDGDPAAWREEARSLVVRGELSVPAEFAAKFFDRGQYFTEHASNGRWYSKYGLMNALVSVPPFAFQAAFAGNVAETGTYPSLLAFNLWNVVLSVALALLLYALAGCYTTRTSVRVIFVLATLYASALWFYLRAQSGELYQAVFFAALFLCLVRFLRTRAWGWLGGVWLFAAALLLTRVAYGMLLPLIAVVVWYCVRPSPGRSILILVLPPAVALALLGWINHVKFGSPWMTGYHQWNAGVVDPTGRLADGLWGFLFSPRFSAFAHFPLLILALAGAREFWRRHRPEALALLALFVPYLFFVSKLSIWAGEFSYGPRYLVFALPVLSLPAVVLIDWVLENSRAWRARAVAAAAVVVLAYSTYLQIQVNRLGFWAYYEARAALELVYSDAAADWFRDRHVGVVSADLIRHRDNLAALPWFAEFRRRVSPEIAQQYLRAVRHIVDRGNWYWSLPPEART